MPPTDPPPGGIPQFVWNAARDLFDKMDAIDDASAELNLSEDFDLLEEVDEAREEWCLAVARIITDHISKHRLMLEGTMEVQP